MKLLLGLCFAWLCMHYSFAGFIDIIDILPYNLTLPGNYIQPMARYIVQGGSSIGERVIGTIHTNADIEFHAQTFDTQVVLVGYTVTQVATFQPQACRPRDLDAGDGQFANMSALYQDPQAVQLSFPSPFRRRLMALGDPALNDLQQLASVPTIESGTCNSSPSAADIAEGALAIGAEGALAGGIYGGGLGAVYGFAAGALVGALSAANSQTSTVACQVQLNLRMAEYQTRIEDAWLGQGQGGGGLLAQINASNYAALGLQEKAQAYATSTDLRWQIQNNFTQTEVNGWLDLYHSMMKVQTNLTNTNTKVLKALTDYTTSTFQALDSDMAALTTSISVANTNFANEASVFFGMQASIEAVQARVTFELNNLYGMEEQVVDQMSSLAQLLVARATLRDERRALGLSYWQTRDLHALVGLVAFLDSSTEGVRPTQQFPPVTELTYPQLAFGVGDPNGQSSLFVPDGTGDSFEHITIVYTKPDTNTPGSQNTVIYADEVYAYAQPSFELNDVDPQFTFKDMQLYMGAPGACYNSRTCNLWTTKFTHSCLSTTFTGAPGDTVQLPYTLDNPYVYTSSRTHQQVALDNPPNYILDDLLGCTKNTLADPQTFPQMPPSLSGNPSYNMVGMYSNHAFNDYLTRLCNDSSATGPIFMYSWLWSKGVLLQRNPQACSTGYRQLQADVVSNSALTVPYAMYTILQTALQHDLSANSQRELYQYGAIADHMSYTHIPFVFRADAAYTLECYLAAYVAVPPKLVPIYALIPMGWTYTGSTVSDINGPLPVNVQGREGLSLPIGDGWLYVGFLECLFTSSCGTDGRFLFDPSVFALTGASYAPARAHKADYILTQAITNHGLRYTYHNPLLVGSPAYSFSNFLDDWHVDFDAKLATSSVYAYRHNVVPASLCDPTTGQCTCPCANHTAFCSCVPTVNHTCACDPLFAHLMTEVVNPQTGIGPFGGLLQNYGVVSNAPGNYEETTVLSFVPIVWTQRLTYEQATGPNAPPPLALNCPFQQHVSITANPGVFPQLSIWNSDKINALTINILVGNYTGASSACQATYFNETFNPDTTRSFIVPPCSPQLISIWQAGFSALCFNLPVSFASSSLPEQITQDSLPPPYINTIVDYVANTTDVALFNIGLALSVGVSSLMKTIQTPEFQTAIRQPPGSPELIAAITNVSAQAAAFKSIIIQQAANVTSAYAPTLSLISDAQVQAQQLKNSTNQFDRQYAGFQSAYQQLAPILNSRNGTSILARMINLTNEQAAFDAQFSHTLQAAAALPSQPSQLFLPSPDILGQLGGIGTYLANKGEEWFAALANFVETLGDEAACSLLSHLSIGCGWWTLLTYIFVVIVCLLVTGGTIYVAYLIATGCRDPCCKRCKGQP